MAWLRFLRKAMFSCWAGLFDLVVERKEFDWGKFWSHASNYFWTMNRLHTINKTTLSFVNFVKLHRLPMSRRVFLSRVQSCFKKVEMKKPVKFGIDIHVLFGVSFVMYMLDSSKSRPGIASKQVMAMMKSFYFCWFKVLSMLI